MTGPVMLGARGTATAVRKRRIAHECGIVDAGGEDDALSARSGMQLSLFAARPA